MKRASIAAGLAAFCLLSLASPGARSQNQQLLAWCSGYADVAIVAASFAKQGVPREKVEAALPDMYGFNDAKALETAKRIVDAGYTDRAKADPAGFAKAVMAACMRNGGNLDSVLGVRL